MTPVSGFSDQGVAVSTSAGTSASHARGAGGVVDPGEQEARNGQAVAAHDEALDVGEVERSLIVGKLAGKRACSSSSVQSLGVEREAGDARADVEVGPDVGGGLLAVGGEEQRARRSGGRHAVGEAPRVVAPGIAGAVAEDRVARRAEAGPQPLEVARSGPSKLLVNSRRAALQVSRRWRAPS